MNMVGKNRTTMCLLCHVKQAHRSAPFESSPGTLPPSCICTHLLAFLQVSYASSSETLSDRERFPSFFRTVPSDARTVVGMVKVVEEFEWRRAAIITEDESLFKAVRSSSRSCYFSLIPN